MSSYEDRLRQQMKQDLVRGDDGWYVYWPLRTGGYSSHDLRVIANALDRKNQEIEESYPKQQEFDFPGGVGDDRIPF